MVIDNKYDFGQVVYLVTDSEQQARIIQSFEVYKNGEILYKVGCGATASYHYDFELSEKENLEIKLK